MDPDERDRVRETVERSAQQGAHDLRLGAISGLSPYPPGVDCNVAPQTGTLWRNSETEPHMDVDFGRHDEMADIVHQDHWSNGSAQSTATFYSDDGGETWTLADTPITRCSGGLQTGPESFDRASDPWLTRLAQAFSTGSRSTVLAVAWMI